MRRVLYGSDDQSIKQDSTLGSQQLTNRMRELDGQKGASKSIGMTFLPKTQLLYYEDLYFI